MKKVIEDFVIVYNDYIKLFDGKLLILHDDSVRHLFSIDELLYKYNPDQIGMCEFHKEKDIAPEGDYFVFAENVHTAFYYVANNDYSEIFCTEFDGTFLWYCADSSDLFISLLTVFISMQTRRILSGKDDLSPDEYFSYYLKCKVLSGDFEDNDEFLRFMCCVVDE